MTEPVYLGIDLGTQSVRVLAVTASGQIAASASQPLQSIRDGVRHEQSPQEWWRATKESCRQVTQQLAGSSVQGTAVCATSGTIVLLDEKDTLASNALMYDDGRAQMEANEVNEVGQALWNRLSYRMQPSWALPKLLWLSRSGAVLKGTKLAHQNDFIHLRLAGKLLATDSSHALKTGYNLIDNCWPQEIIEALQLPLEAFPHVVPPGLQIGEVCEAAAIETGIRAGTPIFAGMTDGCAAQIASGAITPGSWNCVVGTTMVMKGVTPQLLHDRSGVVYSHRSSDGHWLPGGASSCGAGLIAQQFHADEMELLNRSALTSGPTGVVVYPLPGTGERFPFFAPNAHGFTIGDPTNRATQYKATLEGLACVERLALDLLRKRGAPMHGSYTISGGATRSEAFNQLRATMLQRALNIPSVTEGAFGMAVLAASASSSLQDATLRMIRMERTIEPTSDIKPYADQYGCFVNELHRRGWIDSELSSFALKGIA